MAGHNYNIIPDSSGNKRQSGKAYEEKAAEYLINQRYRICEKNYFCKNGEADIIAREENILVFVEVKFRRNSLNGDPLEAVTPAKMRKLCRVADYYMFSHNMTECNIRFDVIGILGDEIKHIKNAFEYR